MIDEEIYAISKCKSTCQSVARFDLSYLLGSTAGGFAVCLGSRYLLRALFKSF